MYAPKRISNYMEQKLIELEAEIDKSTLQLENSTLSVIQRTREQKNSKDIDDNRHYQPT